MALTNPLLTKFSLSIIHSKGGYLLKNYQCTLGGLFKMVHTLKAHQQLGHFVKVRVDFPLKEKN